MQTGCPQLVSRIVRISACSFPASAACSLIADARSFDPSVSIVNQGVHSWSRRSTFSPFAIHKLDRGGRELESCDHDFGR